MKKRSSDLLQFGLSIGIFIALALISSAFYFKWDITAEKRNSLSNSTQELLESLEEPVYVRVYLHGEYPADYKRLEQSVEERLAEFSSVSNGLIEYEFIDPYEEADEKKRQEIFAALDEKGLKFSNITYEKDGQEINKIIWPGAIVEYQGEEFPIQFMRSEMPMSSPEMINFSVNNLEYELASSFRRIFRKEKPRIAVLEGHKEIERMHMADLLYSLKDNYDIRPVTIDAKLNALSDKLSEMQFRSNIYDLLIVAGTDTVVPDKDRFIIDQFVMNGGKVLWMLDGLTMDLDSLKKGGMALAISNENGLYEMLYEYGVRLNRDMIIDFQGAPIVVDNGPMGNQRSYVEKSNYYAPILTSERHSHPIAANLDPIFTEFAGSIDTVNQNPKIKKTPFLFSSDLAKSFKAPVRIDLELLREGPEYFKANNKAHQIMGILMEGEFTSAFKDFLPDSIRRNPVIAFRESSAPTKMILISDADIAYNEVVTEDGKKFPLPLGYSKQYKKVIYDNKDLLMNCVNYLLDDAGLIDVRTKNIQVRKLNKERVIAEENFWKTMNVASPLLILAATSGILLFLRKRKWTKKNGQ
ncbi:MAG: gliding motility-associated ABC transporter substrate-binding protein GldG [Bacteroidetes bacterium]|nr:gliding motility-associated ABC transporter substrate-binding protein GldG [Bacteroidota bacterium]